MNISHLKAFSWFAALLAGGGLTWYVVDFVQKREAMDVLPTDDIDRVLENIPEPDIKQDRLVDYQRLLDGVSRLNWTGELPRETVAETIPDKPENVVIPKTPVSDLLRVVYIQVDTVLASHSLAYVSYKDAELAKDGDYALLREDDRLPGEHGNIRLVEITPLEVVFAFDDEEREHERVGPLEFSSLVELVTVGPNGPILPDIYTRQAASTAYITQTWNEETKEVRPGEYRVGTRDAELIGDNWSEVLANDLRYRRWRNPSTGRYEGIYINDIKNGSVAGKFGIESGDILKSINGTPVTSSQEAISFVKQEVKEKVIEKWYVVIEKLGKEQTIVIDTP